MVISDLDVPLERGESDAEGMGLALGLRLPASPPTRQRSGGQRARAASGPEATGPVEQEAHAPQVHCLDAPPEVELQERLLWFAPGLLQCIAIE